MYNPYNYNPYNYAQTFQQPQQQQPQTFMNTIGGLQGKSIDSLEVVKSMDIPLDGSVSYFPLANGTAIATKQLQTDGTSKITIYKPVDNTETNQPKYLTMDDVKDLNSKDIKDIKDEIKSLKRQIRDLKEDKEE